MTSRDQRHQRGPALLRWAALVVGAVVLNYLVAWAALWRADWDSMATLEQNDRTPWPRGYVPDEWPTPSFLLRKSDVGVSVSRWIGVSPDGSNEYILDIYQSGWPFRAFRTFRRQRIETTETTVLERPVPEPNWWDRGLSLPGIPDEDWNRFPVRPVPAGFVVNVGVYTLAGLVPVWIFRKRCRARRKRRGLCVGCGYDLAGLAAPARCPECRRSVSSDR